MDIFSLVYHFSLLSPSLWETARYRLKYCLKGPLSPKQPINHLSTFSLSLGDGPIKTEIQSQGAVKPKTTNQSHSLLETVRYRLKYCLKGPLNQKQSINTTSLRSTNPRRGGRVVQRCWVNFQCRGVLLIWIIVGQWPIALAIGAGGGCLDISTLIYHFSFLSPSLLETARYRLKYCLKGP